VSVPTPARGMVNPAAILRPQGTASDAPAPTPARGVVPDQAAAPTASAGPDHPRAEEPAAPRPRAPITPHHGARPAGSRATLPPAGAFSCPRSPADFLALELGAESLAVDRTPLPLPTLLAALARLSRLSGQLTLESGSDAVTIGVEAGSLVGTQREREQVRMAFTWTQGRYRIGNTAPAAAGAARQAEPALAVLVKGARTILRGTPSSHVTAAFGARNQMAARLSSFGRAALMGLGLSSREVRFAQRDLDASAAVPELLAASAVNQETSWPLLVIFQMLGMLEWSTPPVRVEATLAEQLAARLTALEHADHFETLGVHWSVQTAEIEAAYRARLAEVAPGSAAHREARATAERIVERLQAAYEAVIDEHARYAYIAATYHTDFRALSSLLDAQTKSFEMRGDHSGAATSKSLVQEMHAVVDIQQRLEEADDASEDGGGDDPTGQPPGKGS